VGHYRVRRIDVRTGLISTVAGDGKYAHASDATANSLGSTLAISVDPLDRLLIADRYESVVHSVNLNTGRMTLLVDLSDYDSEPTGVVGDAAGTSTSPIGIGTRCTAIPRKASCLSPRALAITAPRRSAATAGRRIRPI